MHESDVLIMKYERGESIVMWAILMATWQVISDINPLSRVEHPWNEKYSAFKKIKC